MDCEKFESILLDELYDELDEVTSAAAKRHVSGCARCAALLSGLKATRRLAVLPVVATPPGLEDRILAPAREAQKVVPIGRRVSSAVSLAGTWAMRPQTAMAALFLLMIGSSALLLKGKVSKPPSSTMIVSEQGEPVGSAAAETMVAATASESLAKAAPTSPATVPAYGVAPPVVGPAGDSVDGLVARAARPRAADTGDRPKGLGGTSDSLEELRGGTGAAHAAGGGGGGSGRGASAPGALAQQAPPPPMARPAPAPANQQEANASGSASKDDEGPAPAKAQAPLTDFDNAMNAYNSGDYATANQLWDPGARNGDLNAALWQTRAVRESSGCGAAAPRFDRVAVQAGVSAIAYDAMFDAAKCYRALGQYDAARARLNQLLLVPSYIHRAQNELNAMGPKTNARSRVQTQQAPAAAAPPPAATGNGL